MPGTTVDRNASESPHGGHFYDDGLKRTLELAAVDFDSAIAATSLPVPAGMRYCKITGVELRVTETFPALTTLPSKIFMGTAADPDKYLDFQFVSLAATDSADLADASNLNPIKQNLIDCGAGGDNISQIEITFQPNTGGTPAGIADVKIYTEWW